MGVHGRGGRASASRCAATARSPRSTSRRCRTRASPPTCRRRRWCCSRSPKGRRSSPRTSSRTASSSSTSSTVSAPASRPAATTPWSPGRATLSGTVVEAPDLRGGAALVTAGLVADGRHGGAQRAPHRPRVRRPRRASCGDSARTSRRAGEEPRTEPETRASLSHARTRPCAARERAAAEEHEQLPGLQGRRGRARPRGGAARRRRSPRRRRARGARRAARGAGRAAPLVDLGARRRGRRGRGASCTGSTAARRSATPGPPSTSPSATGKVPGWAVRRGAGRRGRRRRRSSPPTSPSAVTSPSSWSAWPSWWSCWPRPGLAVGYANGTVGDVGQTGSAAKTPRRSPDRRGRRGDASRRIPDKPMNILLIGSRQEHRPRRPRALGHADPRAPRPGDQEHLDALAAARPAASTSPASATTR